MAELSLWFAKQAGMTSCELEQTLFVGNPFNKEIVAVRGKTAGAYKDAGTFQWTPGVKALSIIFLTALSRLLKGSKTVLPLLEGGRGSFASSLDYALNKQPEWLFDMFGADNKGDSYLRQLLLRSNSGRRRTGPVRISLNEDFLAPSSIKVYLDNILINDAELLQRLALAIMSMEYDTQTQGPFTDEGFAEHIGSDFSEAWISTMEESAFPIITPVTQADIVDIHAYEKEHLSSSYATQERLLEWRQHDPNNYMCIKEIGSSFMAYYLIMFLKPASLNAYLSGDLQEVDITSADLVTPSGEVYARQEAVHICVFASRMHASMFTVDLLWHLVGRMLELATNGYLSTIYAEPATREGETILTRFGFRPISNRKGNTVLELKVNPAILREWERRYSSSCKTTLN